MTADLIYRRRWWTLVVLSLSLLVIGLDNTILNVAIPSLRGDLSASSSDLQWILDSYMLVFAGLLLTAGAIGDRFGRKRALQIGLFVFGAGSVLAALSGSSEALIGSRALMGVGAAFIMPSTLSILTNVFPAGERAKAIGIWAGVSGIGIALGPVTGGFLLEHFWWGSVFLVNVPFVAATLLLGVKLVPESRDPASTPLDPLGAGLSMASLMTLVWSIIEAGGDRGWTDGLVLAGFGTALALGAAFVAWELRARYPMLDIRLFRNRRFSAASASLGLVFFGLMGAIFFQTQYFQSVLEYSPFEAGIRIVPIAFGVIFASALSARLTHRVGTKAMVAVGLAVVATGLGLFGVLDAGSSYGLIVTAVVVLGFGLGLTMAPATDSVMGSLPLAKASVGSAMNDATRMVGGALGVAILGSVLAGGYRSGVDSATESLPAPAAEVASDTVGGALHVASQSPDGAPALVDAAQSAFVSGMHTTAFVAAGVALLGSVIALLFLPARENRREAEVAQLPAATEAVALAA
jgi:EmrB/QacA subfamily drug resistance transporter